MMDRDDDVVDRDQVDLAADKRGIRIVGILRLDGFEREMEPLATPSESGMAGVGFDASAFGFAQLQTRRDRVKRPAGVEVDIDPQQLPLGDIRQDVPVESYALVMPVRIE